MNPSSRSYTPAQRLFAAGCGVLCHTLYLVAILAMGLSLYTGMTACRGPFHGLMAAAINLGLLMTFPISHSWLLSARGRRAMSRLIPLGIGSELSTTTFAILSSWQLAATFWFWSPSGTVWWQATGAWRAVMLVPFLGAWLLLGKSILDSHLALQIGSLGWWAVVRNRQPEYRSFSTAGLYRYSRQPIYLAFALILWTGSTWTPDWLVLAVGWSIYCVVGAALKERRFLRYFGEAFRAYQARVPFWWPQRPHPLPATVSSTASAAPVVIIGAGPVGLLLANLLGARGIPTTVVEKRLDGPRQSMAIGITPPSLHILAQVGLDEAFAEDGLPITRAFVHENAEELGAVDFDQIPSTYRFILALPQSQTVRLLRERLPRYPSVTLLTGAEFVSFSQDPSGLAVQLRDVASGIEINTRAAYLIGCDGQRSRVREAVGLPMDGKTYQPRFVMADFEDQTGLGREAHLFFTAEASIEAFPLPDNRRRWIVCASPAAEDNPGAYLIDTVRRLTGYDLSRSPRYFQSGFTTQRWLARRYYRDRVILCGDAAHVMSPIGGQGMNTGFADAELLATVLERALAKPVEAQRLFALYERTRRRAFRVAARRAALGMWLGTRRGLLASALRKRFIREILFRPAIRPRVATWFTMLSVPFHNAAQVRWER